MQERDIESTTTQIKDEHVPLLICLSGAKTISNSSSGRLVDDTEDVQARNGTSILCGLALVVVEISGNSNNSLLNSLAKLGLGNLLHLYVSQTYIRFCDIDPTFEEIYAYLSQDHRGDLLGRKLLGLTEILNLNIGGVITVNNGEGP